LLWTLSEALLAFLDDLAALGVADRVLVDAFSEFGPRVDTQKTETRLIPIFSSDALAILASNFPESRFLSSGDSHLRDNRFMRRSRH
jgi:hypothetical protein